MPSQHWQRAFPLFDLAPEGGCLAADIATRAGGLLHHLFTLTRLQLQCAECFCGPIQKLTPLQELPGFLLYGVRTFLTTLCGAARSPS